jgi:CheY-like chemotaxis protein
VGLTRQLLAFSRKQVLRPRVVSLNDIVNNMTGMLTRLIGENIELRASLDPSLGLVFADPGQLEQVLMNLAVNARDAMPFGGLLIIESRNVVMDDEIARKYVSVRPGPHAILSVSDTGSGMDVAVLNRVFEPFFTTRDAGRGTGLGLSTVYGIVKQSDGYIVAYSEPGRGAAFKIYLPQVDRPLSAPDAIVDRTAAPPRGTELVLVVEDEQSVRDLARAVLEECGYVVLEARDGARALDVCRDHPDPIHLLLTDVVMPGMSGSLLADRARALRPKMKILFMSGYTDDAIVHHGVLDEGTPFLQKPFSPDALALRVREVIDGISDVGGV